MLTALIIAHLVGDFLLQNHWMQRKSEDSFVCVVHILAYSMPFVVIRYTTDLPFLLFLLIFTEHFLQDRFALHLWWMKIYGQTPPDKWPTGPLCVDQAMHIGFIGLFYWLCT